MPAGAQRPQRIAVDTNLLLDRAADDETVLDAFDTICHRLTTLEFILTPTVIEELVHKAEQGDSALDRRLARKVLAHLLEWQVCPMHFIPVGRGIVSEVARKIRCANLLPDEKGSNHSFDVRSSPPCCATGHIGARARASAPNCVGGEKPIRNILNEVKVWFHPISVKGLTEAGRATIVYDV